MKKLLVLFLSLTAYCSLYSQSGWQQQVMSPGSYSLTSVFPVSNNLCYASSEYNTTFENYYYIFRTSNSGANWVQISGGTDWLIKKVWFSDSLNGYAVGGLHRLYMTEDQYGKVVLKTTNGGINWTTVFQLIAIPGSEMEITDLSFISISTGWATGRDGAVLKTTNGGANFNYYYTSPLFRKTSLSFVNSQLGWTAGDSGRTAYSTNGGVNWVTQNKLTNSHLKSIMFINQFTGYVCGNNGVMFKSTNGGLNWTSSVTGITSNLNSLHFLNADTGWAAGFNVIIKTTNGGQNWIAQSFTAASLNSIKFFNPDIGWACGGNKMLYTLNGGAVNINQTSTESPASYTLEQNYPNPFNPVTKIRFDIRNSEFRSQNSEVTLKIYDALGREVETLVSGLYTPGKYEATFDGSNYSSGIYFYRISTEGFSSVKMMMLVK